MHAKHFVSRLAAIAGLIAAAANANAALTAYNSSTSFAAATAHSATDTYDDLVQGTTPTALPNPLSRIAGGYSYVVSAPSGLFRAGTGADVSLATLNTTEQILFNTFSGGVNAIGGLFYAVDGFANLVPGQTMTLTVADSFGAIASSVITGASLSSFAGFSSNGTITSLTLAVGDPEVSAAVNNLVLAQLPTPPVPEPATLGMFLAGLGALAFVRRRRNA